MFLLFVQVDQQGEDQHQQQDPDLDLLEQVMSESDLTLDQTADEDQATADFEQTSPPTKGPEVILSPEKFRIRDAADEEEHNEVIHSFYLYTAGFVGV